MTDLNAGLIGNLATTSDPVQMVTGKDQAAFTKNAADVANTNAVTQYDQSKTTGQNLDNQKVQMDLNNSKALAQAYQSVQQKYASQRANPQTDQGPGVTPVLPDGVKPNWAVDSNMDWYVDKDTGQTIPHSQGPAITPSGRLNLSNPQVIADVYGTAANAAAQNGGNPGTLVAQQQDATKAAQDRDKTQLELGESQQRMRKAQIDQQKAQVDFQDGLANHLKNDAFDVVTAADKGADPATTLQSKINGLPGLYANIKDSQGQPLTSGAQWYDKAVQNQLRAMQVGSENAARSQATSASKTAQVGTEQDIGVKGNAQVAAAAKDVQAQETELDKTDRALQLLQKFRQSHPGATIEDLKQFYSTNPDPDYAELKSLLTTKSLSTIKETNGKSPTNSEFHNLAPSQVSTSMPTTAAENLLWLQRNQEASDLQTSKQFAGSTAKVAKGFGIDTSAAENAANRPFKTEAPGESPVGTVKTFNAGGKDTTFKKVSRGLDHNQSTWQPVQ